MEHSKSLTAPDTQSGARQPVERGPGLGQEIRPGPRRHGVTASIFAAGAAGKLVCGFLGARLGVLTTLLITEGATAAGILALLPLTIGAALLLLPIIGVALNGTSSVLYGTVPELVTPEHRESAFGVFYTGTIGAGALAPLYTDC